MFVLFEVETGWTDESMRFTKLSEALSWADTRPETVYDWRVEA